MSLQEIIDSIISIKECLKNRNCADLTCTDEPCDENRLTSMDELYRRRRRLRQSSLTVSTEFDPELSDSMIEDRVITNQASSGTLQDKERYAKKSHMMSTKISKEVNSNISIDKKDSNPSYVSQNSRFSINSDLGDNGTTDSKRRSRRRKTQFDNLRVPQFGTMIEQDQEESKNDIFESKKGFKNKVCHKSSPVDVDFSSNEYFERRLERSRRTHTSPDDVLHGRKRRSTWKCDLTSLQSKQHDIRMTIERLGLNHKD